MATTTEDLPPELPLEEQIVARVRDWFKRAVPRANDWRNRVETIEIGLHNPGGTDDGTLYLEASVDETSTPHNLEGPVPGVRFR